MKFARELERELVPEWRAKYLDYKAGKKHVKAVARAIARANNTPSLRKGSDLPPRTASTNFFGTNQASSTGRRSHVSPASDPEEVDPLRDTPSPMGRGPRTRPIPVTERAGLTRRAEPGIQYGSFVPTPPADENRRFELPAPAIKDQSRTPDMRTQSKPTAHPSPLAQRAVQHNASIAAPPTAHRTPSASHLTPGRTYSPRQRLARMFSTGSPMNRLSPKTDIWLQTFDEVREREREFYSFLDEQLNKIESFYKQKENQATKRLEILREQLHEMRNRRSEEIIEAKNRKEQNQHHGGDGRGLQNGKDIPGNGWINPLKSKLLPIGPNSKALQNMAPTPRMAGPSGYDDRRDYVRRPNDDVPYRTAKRKLKAALQEFYRGLELLKSYVLLNRTAFRKLNKKYDKAVNARPPLRFMNEKVSKAWFVNSDVIDGHISTVEDLYARYFERGNHKIAAGKLRKLIRRPVEAPGSAFRDGLFLGLGTVFALQGLVYGSELLSDPDSVVATQASYLLQLYGGYFLILYLFGLFCLDCWVWTRSRVNYPFIFEFEPREHLDWKQLAEFPCFFFFLFGLCIWLNFSQFGDWEAMYLYWPIILIAVSLAILCLPAPVWHHKGRRWLLYSHYRLLFAGLYPVEFRDFFLGDIWCSLTYATCNIELFFCLYAKFWQNPVQCNSNHSRLLGFFGALPPIWRALQCMRRYRDTGNVFPQLVNCGKYTMTILSAVFLSLYRLQETDTYLGLFIAFSLINAIYCSIWDLFMDMSLVQPHARHFLLRDILAIKHQWVYYVVMVLDPILRFSWIFYAIFTHDTQHSTIVSFLVGFAEVSRRGMWTIFRVENEHCGNVAQYKASRDVPLPYQLDRFVERPSLDSAIDSVREEGRPQPAQSPIPLQQQQEQQQQQRRPTDASIPHRDGDPASAAEEGRAPTTGPGTPVDESSASRRARTRANTLERSRSIMRFMAEAHRQDFEKKRKPSVGDDERRATENIEDDEDDDDDEEEDEEAAEGMEHGDDGEDVDAVAESAGLLDEQADVYEAQDLVARARMG